MQVTMQLGAALLALAPALSAAQMTTDPSTDIPEELAFISSCTAFKSDATAAYSEILDCGLSLSASILEAKSCSDAEGIATACQCAYYSNLGQCISPLGCPAKATSAFASVQSEYLSMIGCDAAATATDGSSASKKTKSASASGSQPIETGSSATAVTGSSSSGGTGSSVPTTVATQTQTAGSSASGTQTGSQSTAAANGMVVPGALGLGIGLVAALL